MQKEYKQTAITESTAGLLFGLITLSYQQISQFSPRNRYCTVVTGGSGKDLHKKSAPREPQDLFYAFEPNQNQLKTVSKLWLVIQIRSSCNHEIHHSQPFLTIVDFNFDI